MEEFFHAAERELYGGIDVSVPSAARVWNYWLGGKDNFPADQVAGEFYRRAWPGIVGLARCSRMFLACAVRYLAVSEGVRQFIDLGVGLPSPDGDDVHVIAQRVDAAARIVHIDCDPLVVAYARGLLNGCNEGVTAHIEADVEDPASVLEAAAGVLDFTQPVAVLASYVLCHVVDDDQARDVLTRLGVGLPRGSFVVFIDGATAIPAGLARAHADHNLDAPFEPWTLRGPSRVARLLDGLELLPSVLWRPETAALTCPPAVEPLAAICRIPTPFKSTSH